MAGEELQHHTERRELCWCISSALPAEEDDGAVGQRGKGQSYNAIWLLYLRIHKNVPSPIVAYKNKWAIDWASHWFYHKVPLDPAPKRHPLMVKKIGNLGESPKVKVECSPENEM